jgi:uncharacterized protein DUF3987
MLLETKSGLRATFLQHLFPSDRLVSSVNKDAPPAPTWALLARAASENGMNDNLIACPNVISDFEEMDQMMEKTSISGSGGALMSIIRSLFDDTRPGITTTKGRAKVAELGYLSILGSMTPSIWRKSLEGKDSYGTGLGGRFNLVASNETRTSGMLTPIDVSDLRQQFEKLFTKLDGFAQLVSVDPNAKGLMQRWWEGKSKSFFNRVNVITARKALHMAWVTGQSVITEGMMSRAIELAEYLIGVRQAFAVVQGEEKAAIAENRVLQVLLNIQPKAASLAQIVAILDGVMARSTTFRALEALVTNGEVEKITRPGSSKSRGKSYFVYRILGE